MLKLEEKDYDLNFLFKFSFDFAMLKEILLKLAKSNKDLESRIKHLEKSNEEKDNRISNLEEKLKIDYVPEENSEEDKNIIEDKNFDEFDYTKSNLDKEAKTKDKNKEEEYDDEDLQNKDKKSKRSRSIRISRKDFDKLNTFVSYPVSSEAIRSLLKLIKENTERISKLDKNINKKITNSFNELQKKLKDLDSQNAKEHKIIDAKIKDIYNRLYDYNDKMDGIIVKTAPLDNLSSLLKDNGNDNVDSTKVMIQMLEEKINKKIEIIENKEKGDIKIEDNLELKQKIEELEGLIDQLNKDIELLKQNNMDNFDDSIKELKDLIDKKNNDLLLIIEGISNKLKNGEFAGDKMDDILNNIKTEKDKKTKIVKKESIKKSKKDDESEETKAKLSDLKERIKDLNKKINDVDNYFKNVLNNQGQEIGEIKRKIEEINNKLEKKITKDDLKELYHTTEEHSDELKYLQDKISELIEGLQKLQDNNPSFIKRLESLTHEILELKERDVKEVQSKPLDLTKYIDENKLKEALKPYKKNIDILMFEKDSLYNQVKELQEEIKYFETKERVIKLDEEINEKINDVTNKISKKYLDRLEINKLFKNFELQMKLLSDNQRNKETDNWILAKQPLACFNCATCESNIKNLSPTSDYLPWNKYPPGERQYHVGQGFSRLLQRINNDPIFKSYNNEKKEFNPDNDINTNLYSSMSNMKGSNFFFKINNRETMKDDFNENIFKLHKKYKLPKVFANRRKKNNNLDNLPLTDEENERERENKSYESSHSPKIMKITKKRIKDLTGQIITNSQQKIVLAESDSKIDTTTIKPGQKLERVKSMPIYENV